MGPMKVCHTIWVDPRCPIMHANGPMGLHHWVYGSYHKGIVFTLGLHLLSWVPRAMFCLLSSPQA